MFVMQLAFYLSANWTNLRCDSVYFFWVESDNQRRTDFVCLDVRALIGGGHGSSAVQYPTQSQVILAVHQFTRFAPSGWCVC